MATTYLSGTLVRSTAAFATLAGVAADPTTVTLKYRPGPFAAVVTAVYPAAPIVRDSTGTYHADLDTTAAGGGALPWVIEWIGTGAVQAIGTDNWIINPEPL
jgi:hypothetical protein